MDEFFLNIDSFLSKQPWWIVAIGAIIVFSFIKKKLDVTADVNLSPRLDLKEKIQAMKEPVKFETGSSSSVRIVTNKDTFTKNPNSNTKTTELFFEGADANELQALLRKGDKINAIKLIREKNNLDLVTAKSIIDAMSKL